MNQSNDNQTITPVFPGQNNFLNIEGFIQARESAPTAAPRKLSEQIVVVSGGGSSRAYIYDIAARAWKYTALT